MTKPSWNRVKVAGLASLLSFLTCHGACHPPHFFMVSIYFCCNKFHPLLFVFSVFLLGSFAILEQCQFFVLVYLIVQCKNQPVSPNQNVMSLSPSFYQSRLIVALSGNGYFWTVGTSAGWI